MHLIFDLFVSLGITLSFLWKRLSFFGEEFNFNRNDPIFLNYIWSLILSKDSIQFYLLPSPRCIDELAAELDQHKEFHGRFPPQTRQPALFLFTKTDHSAVRMNFFANNIKTLTLNLYICFCYVLLGRCYLSIFTS